jgi:hypothetical protein
MRLRASDSRPRAAILTITSGRRSSASSSLRFPRLPEGQREADRPDNHSNNADDKSGIHQDGPPEVVAAKLAASDLPRGLGTYSSRAGARDPDAWLEYDRVHRLSRSKAVADDVSEISASDPPQRPTSSVASTPDREPYQVGELRFAPTREPWVLELQTDPVDPELADIEQKVRRFCPICRGVRRWRPPRTEESSRAAAKRPGPREPRIQGRLPTRREPTPGSVPRQLARRAVL